MCASRGVSRVARNTADRRGTDNGGNGENGEISQQGCSTVVHSGPLTGIDYDGPAVPPFDFDCQDR
jgi:hypothetical protein